MHKYHEQNASGRSQPAARQECRGTSADRDLKSLAAVTLGEPQRIRPALERAGADPSGMAGFAVEDAEHRMDAMLVVDVMLVMEFMSGGLWGSRQGRQQAQRCDRGQQHLAKHG